MLIQNKISDFLVFETESVLKALEKINQNKNRIVFIVNENGKLSGSFSDGDFRRWITTGDFDFNIEISQVMNTTYLSKRVDSARKEIESLFSKGINVIPLIDEYRRFVAVAIQGDKGISIGKHVISENSPTFIIAEIGNNHNGDINLAKHLVDLAVDAKADCVKFQMRDLGQLYKGGEDKDKSADLGAQYTHDLLSRFQLNNEELIEVFDYCKSKGLTPMCTPWDLNSLYILEQYGMEAYKVASADFTNHEMLEALAATGKPLICSTGMCTEAEIKKSVEFLKSLGAQFVILHCNSTYPTPFKDVNLSYIKRLQNITGGIVGYSGHERGISVPVAAVALGAKVIEKHFTIDKAMEGNDHKVSLLPNEFSDMVSKIREVEESMGKGGERLITQGEMINRENLAKSLIINQELKKGQIITRSMVEIKSPGQGLQPLYIDQLIGRSAIRDFEKGDFFYESDLNDVPVESRNYSFNRPFGIPVRYHDYEKLKAKSNLDFVEFHLSYQDLELNLSDFFTEKQAMGFAVHSPELFANDHILDLASDNDEYRNKSIGYLNKVCEITRQLKYYFPITERPVIVVNAGGFNTKGFIPKENTALLYKRVAESLSQVNQDGVEIIIQTMPPFPWHFGGQSYHNLFVDHAEITNFCSSTGYRICFDTSHSMMACNYYGWSFHDFTLAVAKFTAHMHIVDALGVDGEGVQIGKGDVDFEILAQDLNQEAPNIQFIPEVWQGHKNSGEGFWGALDFLEKYL
ncbi:TPA: TIM barrel protein [Klebsiella pneumoniae]|uniref:N-acetylneuraminate synthase family protein n=1 Tax=Klebsiella TaxID=570 RepID=UPI000E2A8BE8|nr:N-acetylneuraminate synthase family protein [Klebsiella pneumoniae]EIX9320402.1 N-acetylneuraminate synthase family protein [Klebsiella pneumoniae]MBD7488717.1 N-acetylneuraminate synthase family protein [Klebsiella pneumoniae]MBR8629615.1 N-acetylneuraminate synthase family protein [Klebsiella pneumoniae subsp. pneumoniae]MCB3234298.1 N-acetylneuraminate synthase family protein [Klebsiella pneumoniae]MCM2142027.1 N-acetylneuraminate synthase family protein [Klebsiella pneumoniae]